MPAAAATYRVTPLDLGSGFSLVGTVSTDGTLGPLAPANITGWSITVTSINDQRFNPGNSANSSSLVGISGNNLVVPTSPDGVSDGGLLGFQGGIRFGVRPADFTGLAAHGGQASYVFAGGAAFDVLPLGRPNATAYVAGTRADPATSIFTLKPLNFGSGITLSGVVTASDLGGIAQISDWDILIRETRVWRFNQGNSKIFDASGLFATRTALGIVPFDEFGGGNAFQLGFGFLDPTVAILASYLYDPAGEAGFVSPLDYQVTSPLSLDAFGNHIIATGNVPEPATWAMLLAGFAGIGIRLRRGRQPAPGGLKRTAG